MRDTRTAKALAAFAVVTAFTLSVRADVPGTMATAAFERFKKLEGTWRGRSSKGWTPI
jgi:hypothetical protein